MRILAMAAALAVGACSASNTATPNLLQAYGNARIALDPSNPNRLTLSVLNQWDIGGYDFDKSADRLALVDNMFTVQCGKPRVIEQRVTQTSNSDLHKAKVYTLLIDCPNGASQAVQ